MSPLSTALWTVGLIAAVLLLRWVTDRLTAEECAWERELARKRREASAGGGPSSSAAPAEPGRSS